MIIWSQIGTPNPACGMGQYGDADHHEDAPTGIFRDAFSLTEIATIFLRFVLYHSIVPNLKYLLIYFEQWSTPSRKTSSK